MNLPVWCQRWHTLDLAYFCVKSSIVATHNAILLNTKGAVAPRPHRVFGRKAGLDDALVMWQALKGPFGIMSPQIPALL